MRLNVIKNKIRMNPSFNQLGFSSCSLVAWIRRYWARMMMASKSKAKENLCPKYADTIITVTPTKRKINMSGNRYVPQTYMNSAKVVLSSFMSLYAMKSVIRRAQPNIASPIVVAIIEMRRIGI